jgi:hypothetical protein
MTDCCWGWDWGRHKHKRCQICILRLVAIVFGNCSMGTTATLFFTLQIFLSQWPKPAVSAGRRRTFRCFVLGSINYHSKSENFFEFLLTCANLSKFNPGDVLIQTFPGDVSSRFRHTQRNWTQQQASLLKQIISLNHW